MGLLNAELFEESREAYAREAKGLVWAAFAGNLPAAPEAAKAAAFRILTRLNGEKEVERYRASLFEAFDVAYRFATYETWEGLHRESARPMIDRGLKALERQHIEKGEEPLSLSDPEDRLHYTTAGLFAEHPASFELSQQLGAMTAFSRLATIEDTYLLAGLKTSGAKRRHHDRFMRIQRLAWTLGLTLGVLGVLGEVPPDPTGG